MQKLMYIYSMALSDEVINDHSLLQDQVLVFYGTVSEFREERCLLLLSEKEIARGLQYLKNSDRSRYIITRTVLKKKLARILQVSEHDLMFQYGKNGKPFLIDYPELQFSVSHSGELFVIAISFGCAVGIDVEQLNRDTGFLKLQSYLFTPSELEWFQAIDDQYKQKTFIACWTKKEAILKATGAGLTQAMNSLELSVITNGGMAFNSKERSQNDAGCFLECFYPAAAYVAAVAVKGPVKTVRYCAVNEFNLTD